MYYTIKTPTAIDLYEGEFPVDYPPIYRAIFRGSSKFRDGIIREDKRVRDYVSQAKDKNQKFGLYHFMLPNSINRQFDCFMNLVRDVGMGDMPLTLDVEISDLSNFGINRETWAYQIKTFLDLLETETMHKPIIYTSANYWSYVAVNGLWNVNDYPLWTAYYITPVTYIDSVDKPPVLPKGWIKYGLWQYTDRGRTDYNYANDYNVVSDWFKTYLDTTFGDVAQPVPPNQSFPYSIMMNGKTYQEAK